MRASRTLARGNSNIVFWEGGRYDGRDATDCADLLLQGLIAWRRDTAVAEVPGEPETPTVAEARQQQATSIAPARPSGPLCTDTADEPCWMELDDLPDCYVWKPYPQLREIDSWSGQCSDGLGTGTGVYRFNGDEGTVTHEFPHANGVLHGTAVTRWVNGSVRGNSLCERRDSRYAITRQSNGDVFETPYLNGVEHGTAFIRYEDGRVEQAPYVNGVLHGTRVFYSNETRYETPYVNGVAHGTSIVRYGPDSVLAVGETPYVNGEIHGTVVERYKNGAVNERPYVNGEPHGTQTWMHANGRVTETVWVNGDIEVSSRCVAGCD